MQNTPPVLIVDDGELDDVRDILADLGAEFALLRGGAIPDELAPPSRLFVATPRRAMLAREWKKLEDAPSPICVGIVAEDSNTLRSMLRRLGFQLLIRRPVNPYALRLLLLRSLYAGEERRTDDRVPIGAPVAYRSGLRRRSGTIAELSRRGGRLLTDAPLPSDSRITLQLRVPDSDRSLSLRARCIRASEEPVVGDQYAVALSFDETDRTPDLQRVLQHYRSGPAQLAAEFEAEVNDDIESRFPLAAPASDAERRKHERVVFRREVIGLSEEAATVLMGHDLSIGGMRVEGTHDLEVGKRVRLAVFGAPREEPILVRALVTRAEDGGYGLQFVDLGAESGSRLEHLVAHLPSVESLEGDEAEGLGTVVTRILSRED
jgi:hypothetical protein